MVVSWWIVEMYCHDLEVMSSNPGQVELGVRSTSVLSCAWSKNIGTLNTWKAPQKNLTDQACLCMVIIFQTRIAFSSQEKFVPASQKVTSVAG